MRIIEVQYYYDSKNMWKWVSSYCIKSCGKGLFDNTMILNIK